MSGVRQTLFSGTLFLTLLAVLFTPSIGQTDKPQAEQSKELQTLIQELERNEALYRNLKLNLQMVYEQSPGQVDSDKRARQKSELTLIVQGDKYRQEKLTTGRFQQGFLYPTNKPYNRFSSGTTESSAVFDGETLRKFYRYDRTPGLTDEERQQGGHGDISGEQKCMENLFRPHMLLCEHEVRVPLSTWLKGRDAIAASPGWPNYNDGWSYKVQLLGEEEIQGLNCIKIRIEKFHMNGKLTSKTILWLARDRNLIPAQAVFYQPPRSKEIPQCEAWVDEWQEVRPGVWFPRKFHKDRLNWIIYRLKNKQQVGWRKKYQVESIELDPLLPEDTFTKLKFPKGLEVSPRDVENK
ncbi:MAG TPA: hypothetical protein DCM07_22455 [Planctomycetaceae bacterium]|uniref:hypothetical protein n=2 Tax=Gimesia TaxID=1649453 RepID=UPI000C5B0ECA|nr:hypothetical protein [Gimesia sp.]MAX36404.1 hypothetical protein [Gimesia sp.]HAH47571.1 hypothetical protein [Planctomycetaceae bacterium]HBL46592.1 hypothetical protein [Planctomycetaceae bacterium]|tara:strand:+ start:1410 stop:2465 length:1056 start_codon:yes stop_codon:yes gene_type:complete